MRPASPRVLWGLLVPAAVLVLAAWQGSGALGRREAALAREAAGLRAELVAGGFEFSAPDIEQRRARVLAETLRLRESAEGGRALHADPLVREHAGRAFQLIEFERERAAAAQTLREQATAAGVKLDASAFEVLADNSESPQQPRRRWAQLAVARTVAARAVAAKVATYEALPVPAVREIRVAENSPVLAEEILFSVRVTGASARVQDFVEQLALGAGEGDLRFFIEHLVLRKDGVTAPDQASATVVLAGLLPPDETAPAP
ncbi:MAG: hypothetical protein H7067_16005 [Burkholderiales bacterium]|nr:hypothetical protein [Opitutaceae bacterium]